jgi:hypothetical protein
MKIHPKIGFSVFSGTLAKPKVWESLHFICRPEFPSENSGQRGFKVYLENLLKVLNASSKHSRKGGAKSVRFYLFCKKKNAK